MVNKEFLEAYEAVFDERDEMKVCGRQACRNLIEVAKGIDEEKDFGNVRTGQICESSKDILRKMYYENASTAFIDAYESVFDEEGLMKDCKKDSLSELIEAAERVDKGADFGNPKTGEVRMESLDRMKSLYLYVKK